ncbi:helix-turn-helix domain-containing protein [Cellulomonas sp. HZM]|uniref:helix-turn-helix domain-containing protein n=1 Tax=Cellulomonas sp. HZM TaxID=1454010 RepID=UPI0009E0875C|nr:XRE family transcriptional regulator [Cellulomonas sp. HZM]
MNAALLIKEARERAGLTQAQLAARAGTSQPAVARYESGSTSPAVSTLERLLAAAGMTLEVSARPASRTLNARTHRMARLREHRSDVLAAARRHGARDVRVFGSVVRGEDGPSSDIDLLVAMDVERVGLLPADDLRLELEELLGEHVDIAVESMLAPHVAPSALAEAVAL